MFSGKCMYFFEVLTSLFGMVSSFPVARTKFIFYSDVVRTKSKSLNPA